MHPRVASQSSLPLQKSPSLQTEFCLVDTHWSAVRSHLSAVQATWSSQVGSGPLRHPCAWTQNSAPSQNTPLSHLESFGISTQPMLSARESVGLQMPSLHGFAPGSHCAATPSQSVFVLHVKAAATPGQSAATPALPKHYRGHRLLPLGDVNVPGTLPSTSIGPVRPGICRYPPWHAWVRAPRRTLHESLRDRKRP